MLHRTLLMLLLASGMSRLPALEAQRFVGSRSGAKVIILEDGRLAVLNAGPKGAVVENLVAADQEAGPAVDLQVGDLITRFQGIESPTADQISSTYDGLAVGTKVLMGIRRNGSDRSVAFTRPSAPSGGRIAVAGAKGAGTGAWVTGDGPSDVKEMVIAGAHIRNNDEGLPVVTHRTSHPAAATVPLRTGDLIATINGQGIAALAGLELGYGRIPAGGDVVLTVSRDGTTVTVQFAKPNDR